MPRIDVTDEAVIDAQPNVVYKAILDEYAGVTHWWMPVLEIKLRGNKPIDCEGAICDLTAHGKGITAKFSIKVTKIVEAKSIEMDYSGDFVGTGKWTFEPTDGKTKAQYQFNVRTNNLLFSLAAPFMKNPAKPHSDTMQKGFKALNIHLCKK
jgi:ribosome-associated toxin RatA of RatAB toxin-antitoxin module